eukprot:7189444-Pyramimonas_sp.AAC.1
MAGIHDTDVSVVDPFPEASAQVWIPFFRALYTRESTGLRNGFAMICASWKLQKGACCPRSQGGA